MAEVGSVYNVPLGAGGTGTLASNAHGNVSAGLSYDAIEKKLQMESTLGSIFNYSMVDVVYNGKQVSVPDSVVMRVSSEKGARSQTIPMLSPLTGSGVGGTQEKQQGSERTRALRYMKVYYNEYSQAVIGESWGVNYNELEMFNFYKEEQPGLSKWFAEDEDMQYHEALLETYSWPLGKPGAGGSSSSGLTKNWNPNWYVCNAVSQPVYDEVKDDFTTSLAASMQAAATGTNGVNATVDLANLIAISEYAESLRIEPIDLGGQKTYVVALPSNQYYKLLQTTSGQLGEVWENVSALSSEEQNFPGVVGRVMNLLIVKDLRYPTITFDNNYTDDSTGDFATVGYVYPGNDDARYPNGSKLYAAATNPVWEIGFLMGKAAIVDWMVTPLHFETEKTEYGKLYGKGAFTERGIQLGKYDIDTPTATSARNFGSIALAFAGTNVATHVPS